MLEARLAYLLTLSTPVKPGAPHRLLASPEFEARLAEYAVVEPYIAEAYERGRRLAQGDLDARSLGLGRIIGEALKRSFEYTERRPLTGLIAGILVSALVIGYSRASKPTSPPADSAKRIARILYTPAGRDAAYLARSLEAVGDSDLVLALDNAGLTPSRIELNDSPLGTLFEALYPVDAGFSYTIRGVSRVLHIHTLISKAPNTLAGIVRAYLEALSERYRVRLESHGMTTRTLLELDKRLRAQRVQGERILGLIASGLSLALAEAPLSLP